MSKTKNGGLDQYGAEPCERQQFWTAGAEAVNYDKWVFNSPVDKVSNNSLNLSINKVTALQHTTANTISFLPLHDDSITNHQ